MKKVIIPFLIGILFISGHFLLKFDSNGSRSGTLPNASAQSAGRTGQKLADQNYAQSAYLISSDTLSPNAQLALSGFQIDKKSMPNGITVITLKALNSSYSDQQYTLKPGEQLYFIEKTLVDDSEGKEMNPNDDTAVIVNMNGDVI